MLDLDSPRWPELRHAYGAAGDIPGLLRQLEADPGAASDREPWFSLWSALAHQGDVYPASFAAVPHVVRILSVNPTEAGAPYFQFPAWVEICRQREPIEIPADLHTAYREALARLPGLAVAALQRERDDDLLRVALSAIAAAKGAAVVAEAAMELTPEVATEFMQWLGER